MKKQPIPVLICITVIFLSFTLGFFVGRNQNHQTVHLSVLPHQARHDSFPEPVPQADATKPDILFLVDINTAGLDEFSALPGIGETLARRILDYRTQNGPFSRPEELLNVNGIGSGKLESILDYIVTGG